MHNPERINVAEDNSHDIQLSKEKEEILRIVKELLDKEPEILSAKIYGSWLHEDNSIDLDTALIVPSEGGVVDSDVYRKIRYLQQEISQTIKQDVDLVPHTEDELSDFRSPLYHPKHNPTLVSGRNIKGKLDIKSSCDLKVTFSFADLGAVLLYDTRTICRRQITRSLKEEEGRIFVSKLLHGPLNSLTYYSYKNELPYIATNPSDWIGSMKQLDDLFGVNSKSINDFLIECKNQIDFDRALILLRWHEHLVDMVLHGGDSISKYQKFCENFYHVQN